MRCFFIGYGPYRVNMVFGWYRTGFYKVFGVEVQQGGTHSGVTLRGGRGSDQPGKNVSHSSSYVCWQQVYEQLP